MDKLQKTSITKAACSPDIVLKQHKTLGTVRYAMEKAEKAKNAQTVDESWYMVFALYSVYPDGDFKKFLWDKMKELEGMRAEKRSPSEIFSLL